MPFRADKVLDQRKTFSVPQRVRSREIQRLETFETFQRYQLTNVTGKSRVSLPGKGNKGLKSVRHYDELFFIHPSTPPHKQFRLTSSIKPV